MSGTAPFATLPDYILHHACTRPEKPAIVLADRAVTYAMMAQGILRVERRLRALSFKPGEIACVVIESPIRHLIVGAALMRIGRAFASVGRIADVESLDLPIGAYLESKPERSLAGKQHVAVDDSWFEGETESFSPSPATGHADSQAICRVELSSGTTGRPKAICHSVAVVHETVRNYYHSIGHSHWDRLLCLPGLTSNWGFTMAAHALFAGKTLFFAYTPRDAVQMIAVYSLDALVASSQQLRELIREQTQNPTPLTSLRCIMTGGSLVTPALITDTRAKLCNNVTILYGSTEAGGTAFALADRMIGIEGATGYVAPWAVVEAVDDDDRPLPPDTEGNLRIRASCQGQPYPPGRPETHSGFKGGWFYPGDHGLVRADGLLVLRGRKSEIINAGGLKVAPEIIEDMMRNHQAVEDVAAFAFTGELGIEEVALAIVPRRPVETQHILDWCDERNIPVTQIFLVEKLPKSPGGKIHRDLLKRQLLKEA